MPARRCPICLQNWPLTDDYKRCPNPGCEDEKTDRVSNIRAMKKKEATSLVSHYKFEAFYEEWDAAQPAERLIPERAGLLDAGTESASIDTTEKPQ